MLYKCNTYDPTCKGNCPHYDSPHGFLRGVCDTPCSRGEVCKPIGQAVPAMPKKFFMLYVEGRGNPTMKHEYRHVAMKEAERLSQQANNLGKKVFMLETVATCEVKPGPVEWKVL